MTKDEINNLLNQETITFEEFQKFALSTGIYSSKFKALAVCTHKLVGELGELDDAETDADTLLECGDVMWKIALISHHLNFIPNSKHTISNMFAISPKYNEACGKMLRDENYEHVERLEIIKDYVNKSIDHVEFEMDCCDNKITMTDVYKANIKKLTKRKENGTLINPELRTNE